MMSARFAGSLELAQRRRRRLAQEADSLPIASGTPRASRVAQQSSASETGKVSPYSGPRLPRDTMIPGSWSVIAFLGFLGLAAWGAIIWLSLSSFAEEMGVSQLASLTEGSIPRYFSTVALLLTAQLSLLIYWHRSRSRKDFLGRYRVWGWAGLFWCLICLAQTTQCHRGLIDSLNARYAIQCWRAEHLCWFIPLATCLLALYRLVGRDINPSRASSLAWNASFCIGLVVAGMYFGLDLLLPVSWRAAATVAVSMLWQFSLAFFCLIHARYVTHVNNEAGGKRISMRSRFSRWLAGRFSQLGERILSVPLRRFSAAGGKQAAGTSKAVSERRKSTRNRATASVEPAPEGLPEKLKPKAKPPAADGDGPSRKSKVENPENAGEDASVQRPGWGARFRQAVATRWTRASKVTPSSETAAATPKRNAKPTASRDAGKEQAAPQPVPAAPVPPPVKVNATASKEKAAVSAPPEETGPSWGERLKGSLLSRWSRRVDPAQVTAEGAGPHTTPVPEGKKAAAPVVKQKAVTSPAPASEAASRPAEKPASAPRPVPRQEMDDDEDDDDDDSGRMGRKDRKRQKKRERQRD